MHKLITIHPIHPDTYIQYKYKICNTNPPHQLHTYIHTYGYAVCINTTAYLLLPHPHSHGQVLQCAHGDYGGADILSDGPRQVRGQHVEVAQRQGGQHFLREARLAEVVSMGRVANWAEYVAELLRQNLYGEVESGWVSQLTNTAYNTYIHTYILYIYTYYVYLCTSHHKPTHLHVYSIQQIYKSIHTYKHMKYMYTDLQYDK